MPWFACRGASRSAPTRTSLLAGEEPRGVPYQEDAATRRVLRHADQLPALTRSLVDRLLQGGFRRAGLAGLQRSVLRVVALGLRTVGSLPLFLGHVFPPFFGLPSGNLFHTNMRPPTGASRTRQMPSRLLPSCYYNVTVIYRGEVRLDRRKAPSKCTKKAAVLDCPHFRLERGKGNDTAECRGVKAASVNTLIAAWGSR